jgi:hypothetical protein
MPPVTFADDLEDWTDRDVAAYKLGLRFGILTGNLATDSKWVSLTGNALGNALRDALLALAEARVLEPREEPDEQFRGRGASLA